MAIRRSDLRGSAPPRAASRTGRIRIEGVRLLRAAGGRLEIFTEEGRVLHWRVRAWDVVLVGAPAGNPPRPARRLALAVRFPAGATVVLERRGRRVAVAVAPAREARAGDGARPVHEEGDWHDDAESS
ncbi:MAG: hypothetical protein IMW98_10650 [Firmicutes bacterium]|nr:hypothetical protein [Bacillota bacterium]